MESVTTQDLLLLIGEQTVALRVIKQDLKDERDKNEDLTALLSRERNDKEGLQLIIDEQGRRD